MVDRLIETAGVHYAPQITGIKPFYTQFMAEDWAGREYRIPASIHHIPRDSLITSSTIHMLVNGEMTARTWGVIESSIKIDRETGDLVLSSGTPYSGEFLVLAGLLRGG